MTQNDTNTNERQPLLAHSSSSSSATSVEQQKSSGWRAYFKRNEGLLLIATSQVRSVVWNVCNITDVGLERLQLFFASMTVAVKKMSTTKPIISTTQVRISWNPFHWESLTDTLCTSIAGLCSHGNESNCTINLPSNAVQTFSSWPTSSLCYTCTHQASPSLCLLEILIQTTSGLSQKYHIHSWVHRRYAVCCSCVVFLGASLNNIVLSFSIHWYKYAKKIRFIGLSSLYTALRYISLSDSVVVTFIAPIMTGIAGKLFLHEPFSARQALAGCMFTSLEFHSLLC